MAQFIILDSHNYKAVTKGYNYETIREIIKTNFENARVDDYDCFTLNGIGYVILQLLN